MQISEVETFCIGKQTQLFFLKGEGQVVFFTEKSIIARWLASSMYKRLDVDLSYLLCVDLEALKLQVLLFCFTFSLLYIFKNNVIII